MKKEAYYWGMKTKTLDDVIKHFGGIPALAMALNIRPQAIYQWKRDIPTARKFEIQVLTKGEITVRQLENNSG